MKLMRKRLIILGVVVVAVAIVVVFVVQRRTRTGFVAGSVHDDVTDVVKSWANLPTLPADESVLEILWSTRGSHFEFYPYAAQDLANKVNFKFKNSKKVVILYTDINAVANPGGKVKSVADLATAVRQNYIPKE